MKDLRDMYINKKVISIGTISDLTGLSTRKIRYYEEKGLIFPERTENGNRKYSFNDIEILINIAYHREEGIQTAEIKRELKKEQNQKDIKRKMIAGQINAHFDR